MCDVLSRLDVGVEKEKNGEPMGAIKKEGFFLSFFLSTETCQLQTWMEGRCGRNCSGEGGVMTLHSTDTKVPITYQKQWE